MLNPHGLFITGTDTGVGKTLVTAVLAALLQEKGFETGLMKPYQTGVTGKVGPDIKVYRKFTRIADPLTLVSPICFKAPEAPAIASKLERRRASFENAMESLYI